MEGQLPRAARGTATAPRRARPRGRASGRCASREVRRESDTIRSFRLVARRRRLATPPARPGQYLTVRVRRAPTRRRWSAATRCRTCPTRRLPHQRQARGRRQPLPARRVAVGDVLDVAAPRGAFVLRDGERPVVLISAGVGATPVLAMLQALAAERAPRPVWWVHGARDAREHAFAARSTGAARRPPGRAPARRLQPRRTARTARPTTSPAGSTPPRSSAPACRSMPTTTSAARAASCGPRGGARPPAASHPSGSPPRRSAPSPVTARASSRAGDRPPHPPDGPPGCGPTVSFARSGLASPGTTAAPSLLELAEACDVPAASAAAPASATTARAGSSPERWPTRPSRSSRPPRAASSCCCAGRPRTLTLDL